MPKITDSISLRMVAPFVGAWIEIVLKGIYASPTPSLRSSERGLKSAIVSQTFERILVAPFVGAWIEIGEHTPTIPMILSLRSSERGLKSHQASTSPLLHRRSVRRSVD